MPYDWQGQFAKGATGVEQLIALLREQGREVTDLAHVMLAQQRGIDLVVDGQLWEVKTDSHQPINLFLELSCKDKPGCLFASRADILAYWFPGAGKLVMAGLPDLQYWLFEHGQEYARKTVTSRAGRSTWTATGIVVPLPVLACLPSYEVHTWPYPFPASPPSPPSPAQATPPLAPVPPSLSVVRLMNSTR